MPLMGKEQVEKTYNSYEEIAKAFGECTEIYLVTHKNSDGPSHYEMVSRPELREALFDSPYITKAELAWSRERGSILPYKT